MQSESEREALEVQMFQNEFDFSPLDIPDMLGKVNYCPICGVAMVRRTEFFDIGMHTESISFYECPRCGETR